MWSMLSIIYKVSHNVDRDGLVVGVPLASLWFLHLYCVEYTGWDGRVAVDRVRSVLVKGPSLKWRSSRFEQSAAQCHRSYGRPTVEHHNVNVNARD